MKKVTDNLLSITLLILSIMLWITAIYLVIKE